MINLKFEGTVKSINAVQYQTAKGHRYDIYKLIVTNGNDTLEFTAREKVIKLVKSIVQGDYILISANLLCRITHKYTFITLDIENVTNTTQYAT